MFSHILTNKVINELGNSLTLQTAHGANVFDRFRGTCQVDPGRAASFAPGSAHLVLICGLFLLGICPARFSFRFRHCFVPLSFRWVNISTLQIKSLKSSFIALEGHTIKRIPVARTLMVSSPNQAPLREAASHAGYRNPFCQRSPAIAYKACSGTVKASAIADRSHLRLPY